MAKQTDSLLDVSAVFLFGRPVDELTVNPPAMSEKPPRRGDNKFLQKQMAPDTNPQLARIYAFSFEGAYYELSRPTIFLVHGMGSKIDEVPEVAGLEMISRAPAAPEVSGLSSQAGSFARGMKVWVYDKGDFTFRLDLLTGTFEQILLAIEGGAGDPRFATSGVMTRSSGVMTRSSGVMTRSSGVMTRRGGSDLD